MGVTFSAPAHALPLSGTSGVEPLNGFGGTSVCEGEGEGEREERDRDRPAASVFDACKVGVLRCPRPFRLVFAKPFAIVAADITLPPPPLPGDASSNAPFSI